MLADQEQPPQEQLQEQEQQQQQQQEPQQPQQHPRRAFVTMIMTASFVPGARVLLSSLRSACRIPACTAVVVLVTSAVPASARRALQPLCDEVREVEAIPNPFAPHVQGWTDSGFTKLHIWALEEYARVVYIDADCLVLQDLNEVRCASDVDSRLLAPGQR